MATHGALKTKPPNIIQATPLHRQRWPSSDPAVSPLDVGISKQQLFGVFN